MLRITENLVGDISLSVALDLNFFSSSILFLSCRKCYKKRDIQTLGHVSGVIMRVSKHVHGNSLLFLIKLKIISFLFRFFRGLVLKADIFGKTAISGQLGSVEEYDCGGSNSWAEVLTSICNRLCFAL